MVRIDQLLEEPTRVVGSDGRLHPVAPAFQTGTKPVYRLRTRAGYEVKVTADHRIHTANRGDVAAAELTKDDWVVLGRPCLGYESLDSRVGEFLGLSLGDGCLMGEQETALVTLAPEEDAVAAHIQESLHAYKVEHAADGRGARESHVNQPQTTLRIGTSSRCVVDQLKRFAVRLKVAPRSSLRMPHLDWIGSLLQRCCVDSSRLMVASPITARRASMWHSIPARLNS
jgi:ribonucleoside-diphosphate reductase alpha chain